MFHLSCLYLFIPSKRKRADENGEKNGDDGGSESAFPFGVGLISVVEFVEIYF